MQGYPPFLPATEELLHAPELHEPIIVPWASAHDSNSSGSDGSLHSIMADANHQEVHRKLQQQQQMSGPTKVQTWQQGQIPTTTKRQIVQPAKSTPQTQRKPAITAIPIRASAKGRTTSIKKKKHDETDEEDHEMLDGSEQEDDETQYESANSDEEGLFVSEQEKISRRTPQTPKTAQRQRTNRNRHNSSPIAPRFRSDIHHQNTRNRSDQSPLSRTEARKKIAEFPPMYDDKPIETSLGKGYGPSRYSGARDLAWHTNKMPDEPSRIERVSKAALLKRGLEEGEEETVLHRGYGASDPENIEIVNLKDAKGYSFVEIADILNRKRVAEGRDPKLTSTACNGRYNRTAPIIYESRGEEFVPISQRKKSNPASARHGMPRDPGYLDGASWNGELDEVLVEIVRQYDKEKWDVVKGRFEQRTGMRVHDTMQLAKRFGAL